MRQILFALGLLAASAWGADAKPFTFIALGCMPYGEESWPGFERLIAEINRQRPAFTVHCGDIKRGSDPPSDRLLDRVHAAFQSFDGPLIYTPGDNEWTDVMRESAGASDPLVWLAKIREKFFNDVRSLGREPIALSRQNSDPQFGRFVENARWTKDGVVFATVHVVGSNNNNRPEVAGAVAEFAERDAANRAWVKSSFSQARTSQAAGIALFFHADIFAEDFGRPVADSGHKQFIETLEEEARTFPKPVLLVHADEHRHRLEKSIRFERDRARLPHVTRLETFGAVDLHAVQVIVDSTSAQVFLAGPLLVPGNDLPLLPRKAGAE